MENISNRLNVAIDNMKEEKDMFGFKTGNKKEKLIDKIDDFVREYEDEIIVGVMAINTGLVAYGFYQIGKAVGAIDTVNELDKDGLINWKKYHGIE